MEAQRSEQNEMFCNTLCLLQVGRYAKVAHQLEKGLPPNEVVPILKKKITAMREKVCWPFCTYK